MSSGVLRSAQFGLVRYANRYFTTQEPMTVEENAPTDPALLQQHLEDSLFTNLYGYGRYSFTAEAKQRYVRAALRTSVAPLAMDEALTFAPQYQYDLKGMWNDVAKPHDDEETVKEFGRRVQREWFNGQRSGSRTLLDAGLDLIATDEQVNAFSRTALGRTTFYNLSTFFAHDKAANVQANHVGCVVLMALQAHTVAEVERMLVSIGTFDVQLSAAAFVRCLDLMASDPGLAHMPIDLLAPLAK